MKIKLEKQHYQWGLTIFLVILACFIVFFMLLRADSVGEGLGKIGHALKPIIYGMVMAYLLCPIYNFSVSRFYSLINKGKYKFKHDLTFAKIIGTIISVAILLVAIAGVLWMIIPGLIDSIMKVIDILPGAMTTFTNWVDVKFANLPVAKDYIDQISDNITDYAIDFATNTILPNSGNMAAAISGTVFGAIGFFMNFIIGIIVCVYFLRQRLRRGKQIPRQGLLHALKTAEAQLVAETEYCGIRAGGSIRQFAHGHVHHVRRILQYIIRQLLFRFGQSVIAAAQ